MVLEAIIAGTAISAISFGITTYVKLNERMTRIEILQELWLRKNGVSNEEIKNEINNHKNRRSK